MNWSASLEGKCLLALQMSKGCPFVERPCKNIFSPLSSSGISDSGMEFRGTKEALHSLHCTNIFAVLSMSNDLAIRNLVKVISPYVCTKLICQNKKVMIFKFVKDEIKEYLSGRAKIVNCSPQLGYCKFLILVHFLLLHLSVCCKNATSTQFVKGKRGKETRGGWNE